MLFRLPRSQTVLTNATRRCTTNVSYVPDEFIHANTALLPAEQEFKNMTQQALEYITKDIYHFHDNPNASHICGTGYKWLHSKDKNESEAHSDIYNKFQEDLPMDGVDFNEILKLYFDHIHLSTNDNQSGYMCFMPSGGLPTAAIGEFIASSTNRSSTFFNVFPSGSSIEQCLLKWFSQIIGSPFYNDNCGGYLTSGGSMANLMALNTIRDYYTDTIYNDNDINITDFTLYCSDQIHYSIEQSAKFIGIPLTNLRKIYSDDITKEININLLRETIQYDIKCGYKPISIIGTAGTTGTGAIDNLTKIYSLCREYNLWFHVDAAYGGFFNITERGKAALNGIQFADSIVLDPHKTFFMPYGVGSLLLKDINHLAKSNGFTGSYLHYKDDINGNNLCGVDISDLSFELTRSFRALGPWFAFKTMGFNSFIHELDKKLDLKIFCEEYIKSNSQFVQIVHSSKLSLFTFNLNLENILNEISDEYGCDKMNVHKYFNDVEIDELNKRFLDTINSKGNIILSAVHNKSERFAIRMIVLSFRTQRSDIVQALEDIQCSSREMYLLVKDNVSSKFQISKYN